MTDYLFWVAIDTKINLLHLFVTLIAPKQNSVLTFIVISLGFIDLLVSYMSKNNLN